MAAVKKANSKEERERKRKLAFILYVDNRLEQKVISGIVDISENTLSKWKAEDDWDEAKRMASIGADAQMRRIMRRYDKLLTLIESRDHPNDVPDTKEADVLVKLGSAVKLLQTEIVYGHKTAVGKDFLAYIQKAKGHAKAIEVIELWHEYLMATQ